MLQPFNSKSYKQKHWDKLGAFSNGDPRGFENKHFSLPPPQHPHPHSLAFLLVLLLVFVWFVLQCPLRIVREQVLYTLYRGLPWYSIRDGKSFSVRILNTFLHVFSVSMLRVRSLSHLDSLAFVLIYFFPLSGRLMYLLPVILLHIIVYKLYFSSLEALRIFSLYIVFIYSIVMWSGVGFLNYY